MIYIRKGKAPDELIEFRKQNPNFGFDDLLSDVKAVLRKSLLDEQGSLCAYCMNRIHDDADEVKIEHYVPRTPDNELDYGNLLAVCKGSEGKTRKRQHCDTRKGNSELHIDPQNPEHMRQISYKPDGTIFARDNDGFNRDINETLNLNDDFGYLKNNRKTVLDQFKSWLKTKLGDKSAAPDFMKKVLASYTYRNNGELKPYCGIIIEYICRRLNAQV